MMNVFIATLFHLIMAYGGSYVLYLTTSPYYGFFHYNYHHLDLVNGLLAVTFAYFMIDLVWMIKNYQKSQFIYFVHHIIGIGSTVLVYMHYMNFVRYYLCFLLYEISTPFLNLSYYYHKNNVKNFISVISEVTFAITFTLIRVIGGTYLTYNLCLDIIKNDMHFVLCGLPILLQSMMYYWFNGMINMLTKKYIN